MYIYKHLTLQTTSHITSLLQHSNISYCKLLPILNLSRIFKTRSSQRGEELVVNYECSV